MAIKAYMLARTARRYLALIFLVIVLSRQEWASAFGRGTSINKARLSPVPVAILGAQNLKFVQDTRRAQTMLNDVARVLCVPGEYLIESGLVGGKRGLKSKKKPKSVWERCGAWAKGLTKDKGLAAVVQGNHMMIFASWSLILAAAWACIFPSGSVMQICMVSTAAFYIAATHRPQANPRPEQMIYIAAGIAVIDFLLDFFFLGPIDSARKEEVQTAAREARREKKKKARKAEEAANKTD